MTTKNLDQLFETLKQRAQSKQADSYTHQLLKKGVNRIAQKVGEEGVEVAIAAVSGQRQQLIEESVDLLYHLCVLLIDADIDLDEIWREASNRAQQKDGE